MGHKHTVPAPKSQRPKSLFTNPRPGGRAYERKRGYARTVEVTLAMRHSLNGKFYGPGRVKLPRHKAEMFLNTEYEAAQKEVSLQQQQAYLLVNRGGVIGKRQVPFAQFDALLATSEVTFP